MNKSITTVLTLIAGLAGGVISHYLFFPAPVLAEEPSLEIRAQKFVLVDENGAVRGVFGFGRDGSPELQVKYKRPIGLAKIIRTEFGSARFLGVQGKSVLPELRSAQGPKTDPHGGGE